MTSNVIPLPFKGDLIDYIKLHGREIEWLWRDGEAYIPVKPICEILGLDWRSQRQKIVATQNALITARQAVIGTANVPPVGALNTPTVTLKVIVGDQNVPSAIHKMMTTGADGKQYEMFCLAYPDFMMWLATISLSRVKPEARNAVVVMHDEIKLLLSNHYHERLLGEVTQYNVAVQKLMLDVTYRVPLRARVIDAVRIGWDFETLWRSGSASRPKLVSVIKDCLALGLIEEAPKGTPFAQFRPKVASDDSQIEMFGHG